MSDLTPLEVRKLEKLFDMSSGYVLSFSNKSMADFFVEMRIDIYAEQYATFGSSKANRLRCFWKHAPNNLVGRSIEQMILHAIEEGFPAAVDASQAKIDEARGIAQRLLADQPVSELDSLVALSDERDFDAVAEQVRDAIEKNQPEVGLDRLHTFVHKFLRVCCEDYDIEITSQKPLHSVLGEYLRALKRDGMFETEMSERIIKSSISTLESFNDVRNNRSLAHDNPILGYEESLLIFNHVASSIRYLRSIRTIVAGRKAALKREEQQTQLESWFRR
jgi:hypothetical protein